MAFSTGCGSLCKSLFVVYTFIFASRLPFSVSTLKQTSSHSQHETSVDDVCTNLTTTLAPLWTTLSPPSANSEQLVSAQVCLNFDGLLSNDLFRLVAVGEVSGHGVCFILETLDVWSKYCWRASTGAQSLKFIPANQTDTSNLRTGRRIKSLTRYIDFLFLVEQPEIIDVNRTQHLARAISDLAKAVHTNVFNIDARFSFVFYPLYGEQYLLVTKFSRDVSNVIEYLLQLQGGRSTPTAEQSRSITDIRLSHYMSVEKALSQVVNVLKLRKGEQLKLQAQHGRLPVTLSHRKDADLHILSFMDLTANNASIQSHDNKELDLETHTKVKIDEYISRVLDELASSGDQSTSFHYFFSSSNLPATTYLGDPLYSVRYSDCTHFNKALTLKALLSSDNKDLADSLQAHILSQGMEMQEHSWNDLQRKGCFLGVAPALSSPSGLWYKFNNVCQDIVGSAKTQQGFFCSPLHGWVKKDEERKGSLFEGKAPLSNQFMASHADLLKPQSVSDRTNNDNVTLPLVQLTVDKNLETNRQTRFTPVIAGHPRILQWSPDKSFIQKMISKRKPTVLKNTVVQTWSALQKWNLSYLETRMGVDTLPSVKCTNNFLTFDPDRRTPLKLNISLPFTPVNMSTESFFKCIQRDSSEATCSDGYKGHYYFGSVPDHLKDDVMPDRFLYHTEKDYKANKQFMWISSAGMITHTHFDQDYNFFVQLVGKKRFTLWSPYQHELMYVYPRVHPMWHKSRVNYRAVDLDKFPAFTQARGKQIELGPGDMLFVPPYTWHYVETLSPSVSLSTWSHDYELYNHMNAIYRHDHKFDLLEDSRGE